MTLTSSALKADALFLQETLQLEVEDESASTITLVGENNEIIMLRREDQCLPQRSPHHRTNLTVLVTNNKTIQNITGFVRDSVSSEEVSLDDDVVSLCRLHLPSSIQLILAPMGLLDSKNGRKLLASRLYSDRLEKRQESVMIGNSIDLDNEGIGDLYDLQLEDDKIVGSVDECDWIGAIGKDCTSFENGITDEQNAEPSAESSPLAAIEVVPAWVDFHDGKVMKRKILVSDGGCLKLASLQDCQSLLRQIQIPTSMKTSLSSRLSNTERLRLLLGWVLTNIDKALISPFLNVKRRSIHHLLSESINLKFHILRALHESHWIEECAEVSTNAILIRNTSTSHVTCKLSISQILLINDVVYPSDDALAILQIETPARTLALLFENENKRKDFRDAISMKQITSSNAPLATLPNGILSTKWKCDQRKLLNCGKLSMTAITVQDPGTIVAACLQLINKIRIEEQSDPLDIHSFLTSIALLKRADISSLTENSRLAFFLNLYHTMIIHAFLALGYPSTGFKFFSFFNKVSYEVGGDMFSLTELEHCILRAKMAAPSVFLSRFILPSSTYDMALTKADFRINFALNCGSLSNPTHIFIYCPDNLDEQLNAATRMFLQKASVTMGGVVELPKICQWFRNDFSSSAVIASNKELVLMMEPYLRQEDTDTISLLRKRNFSFDTMEVRFLQYSYKCTSPQLWHAASEQFSIL